MNDLQRFIEAGDHSYLQALQEIKNGRKIGHWMWYIFPQIKGLGHSPTANYYAIQSFDEAKRFYQHPLLNQRLTTITKALLSLNTSDPVIIFSYPDNLKLRSSMTLFYLVSHDEVFKQVLDKYFNGELDQRTCQILGI
ncbi:DUF1810 domain-containing protein [uncultured Thomasclavelia sp.]|uniref:DUF1810 domain-containing protein n=1 Tax=uncultured Thomasclavelia sp. TaxID=3025759 RepID=UPI0025E32DC0|nr:DUF1810 domain-containing protein [uncultured Thomasclavelia sp.]